MPPFVQATAESVRQRVSHASALLDTAARGQGSDCSCATHASRPEADDVCTLNAGTSTSEAPTSSGHAPNRASVAPYGTKKSVIRYLLEDLALSYFIWTFFLQLWCWLLYGWLMYKVPLLRLPLLGYLGYCLIGPGRHSPSNPATWAPYPLRRAPWHWYISSYFPFQLKRDGAALDPGQRYIFCFHPHGLCSVGAWVNFCTEATGFGQLFPGIDVHPLTLASNLRTPFFREYLMAHGIGDCSRSSCLKILARGSGSAIMLAVGGAYESLLSSPGTYDLCLKKRKGFVRVALQSGAWLVPVVSFGETDHFSTLNHLPHGSPIRRFQRSMEKHVGFTLPIAIGRGIAGFPLGLLPHRVPTVTVVGPPVRVDKFEGDVRSPAFASAVEEVHQRYCTALLDLFARYKDKYAPNRLRDMTLVD